MGQGVGEDKQKQAHEYNEVRSGWVGIAHKDNLMNRRKKKERKNGAGHKIKMKIKMLNPFFLIAPLAGGREGRSERILNLMHLLFLQKSSFLRCSVF